MLCGAYAGRVPVSALPDLMRAAGYYPSAADIDSLLAHVAFLAAMVPDDDAAISGDGSSSSSNKAKSGAGAAAAVGENAGSCAAAAEGRGKAVVAAEGQQQPDQQQKGWQMPDGIDFETFLCLYVNHRPVADVSQQEIEQAFTSLGASGTAAGEGKNFIPDRVLHEAFTSQVPHGGVCTSRSSLQHPGCRGPAPAW